MADEGGGRTSVSSILLKTFSQVSIKQSRHITEAEQTKLSTQIVCRIFKRKDFVPDVDMEIRWRGKIYAILGVIDDNKTPATQIITAEAR